MNKKRSKMTILLILSSFIFFGSVLLFSFGCLIRTQEDLSLKMIIISFITGIVSGTIMISYKQKIDAIMEYGKPVFIAAQHIKKVIEATNILGVEKLYNIVKASLDNTLEEKIKEASKEEKKKKEKEKEKEKEK